jgi:hypothetical protein
MNRILTVDIVRVAGSGWEYVIKMLFAYFVENFTQKVSGYGIS